MSKLRWKPTPVGGYDIPALEDWLECQAARGLLFSLTMGPLTLFDRGEPQTLRIHLEPAREKTDREDLELNALYAQAGWRFLGIFRKNYFVFATADETAPTHTDPVVLGYALNRFLRQKLLGGLGLLAGNLFLLAFYLGRVNFDWIRLRYYPVDTVINDGLVVVLLVILGLFLVDLSYLLGLLALFRLRRRVGRGEPLSPAPGGRLGGLALNLGAAALLVVLASFCSNLYEYGRPNLPLEGSGFVTLNELEGADFRLSGDSMFNMDHISHANVLLEPEVWYFQQYGAFSHFDGGVDLNDVPHLELHVYRYPLSFLAQRMTEEWSRVQSGPEGFQTLEAAYGLDQVMLERSTNYREKTIPL